MADCDVQSVVSGAACFDCGVSEKRLLAAIVFQLCAINQAIDPMAECDVQTIVTQAACVECGLSQKQLLAAAVFLLCQVSANTGPSGTGYQQVFSEAEEVPTIFPDRLDKPAAWHSTLFGTVFWWDPDIQVWT